jgi:hypothetical protein
MALDISVPVSMQRQRKWVMMRRQLFVKVYDAHRKDAEK